MSDLQEIRNVFHAPETLYQTYLPKIDNRSRSTSWFVDTWDGKVWMCTILHGWSIYKAGYRFRMVQKSYFEYYWLCSGNGSTLLGLRKLSKNRRMSSLVISLNDFLLAWNFSRLHRIGIKFFLCLSERLISVFIDNIKSTIISTSIFEGTFLNRLAYWCCSPVVTKSFFLLSTNH
jgi:hypothetical protein